MLVLTDSLNLPAYHQQLGLAVVDYLTKQQDCLELAFAPELEAGLDLA